MTDLRWAGNGSNAAVADAVAAVVAGPGAKTLALPGGTTPGPVFADLARRDLPWATATLISTDERDVPRDDPASNYGTLVRAFGASGAVVAPRARGVVRGRFDLVWVGMGSDGHVASLFPNTDPDPAAPPEVIAVTPDPLPPEAPFSRLTMTLAALANAAQVIVVIRGNAKRTLLAAAAAGENDLPIARLLRLTPATAYWSEA
jgi:6-phosphogluconolactonase